MQFSHIPNACNTAFKQIAKRSRKEGFRVFYWSTSDSASIVLIKQGDREVYTLLYSAKQRKWLYSDKLINLPLKSVDVRDRVIDLMKGKDNVHIKKNIREYIEYLKGYSEEFLN